MLSPDDDDDTDGSIDDDGQELQIRGCYAEFIYVARAFFFRYPAAIRLKRPSWIFPLPRWPARFNLLASPAASERARTRLRSPLRLCQNCSSVLR